MELLWLPIDPTSSHRYRRLIITLRVVVYGAVLVALVALFVDR